MSKALESVNNQTLSIHATAKKYGMKESTIRLRLNNRGKGKDFIESGRKPTLNQTTEAELAQVIRAICNLGFSPTR